MDSTFIGVGMKGGVQGVIWWGPYFQTDAFPTVDTDTDTNDKNDKC